MKKFIQLDGVSKSYQHVSVLKKIDLVIDERDMCAVRGASGSGKSTLLYLLCALEKADSGSLWVDGKNLNALSDEEKSIYRNQKAGIIFQHHFLLPSLNCYDNIQLPFDIFPQFWRAKEKERKEELLHLAQLLGVEHCLYKFPSQLSGGEQQRMNILRAVLKRPKILLCDEPTGNLDSKNAGKVMELIFRIVKELEMTLLVVTHEQSISKLFNREILISDGAILQ